MLQTNRALSEKGTKDWDAPSELRRSLHRVCLHNPNPHKWWELWGLAEMFPLAAGAEIIGPRFSQSFWYSHLEPSFARDAILTRLRLCRRSRLTTWQMLTVFFLHVTHFRLDSSPSSVDYDVYGKNVVSCDEQYQEEPACVLSFQVSGCLCSVFRRSEVNPMWIVTYIMMRQSITAGWQ